MSQTTTPDTDGEKPDVPKPPTTPLTKDAVALRVIANAESNNRTWPEVILKSAFSLGLSKRKWGEARQMAIREFGDYCTLRVVCSTIQASSFMVLERVEETLWQLRKIVKNKNLDPTVRVEAAKVMGAVAVTWKEIGKHCVEVARMMTPKDPVKARNLPPQMPVQINVSGQKADVTIGNQRSSELTPPPRTD
jgi:galactitol-specific phosphotransferase system IIB component